MDIAEPKHAVVSMKYVAGGFVESYDEPPEGGGNYIGVNPEDPVEYSVEYIFCLALSARRSYQRNYTNQFIVEKS